MNASIGYRGVAGKAARTASELSGPTGRLATWLADTTRADIPTSVREHAKHGASRKSLRRNRRKHAGQCLTVSITNSHSLHPKAVHFSDRRAVGGRRSEFSNLDFFACARKRANKPHSRPLQLQKQMNEADINREAKT